MSDLERLKAAGNMYRRAIEGLGIAWPSPAEGEVEPPPRLAEYHDIARVPEELLWLHSFLAPGPASAAVLPEGGWLFSWPESAQEALQYLEYHGAMPFPWRRQIPLFHVDRLVFTLAADDAHAGEVWRYLIDPEYHHIVRAAPDLASLFESWTQIAARDGLFLRLPDNVPWLRSVGQGDEEYLRDTLGVDPYCYPTDPDHADVERWQRDNGIDPEIVDDFRVWEATFYEIADVVRRLDG